jgi:hypothetical protein
MNRIQDKTIDAEGRMSITVYPLENQCIRVIFESCEAVHLVYLLALLSVGMRRK